MIGAKERPLRAMEYRFASGSVRCGVLANWANLLDGPYLFTHLLTIETESSVPKKHILKLEHQSKVRKIEEQFYSVKLRALVTCAAVW